MDERAEVPVRNAHRSRLHCRQLRQRVAVRSHKRVADDRRSAAMVQGVAALGSALVRAAVVVLIAGLLVLGCGNRVTAESVRNKDEQRIETSKNMPGNDVPLDPADEGR